MSQIRCLSLFLSLSVLSAQVAHARDAARDLSRMVGFTIINASTVKQVTVGGAGEKLIVLANGNVFKVTLLLLDPLPLTEVVIFAKPPSKEIIEKFGDTLPKELLTQYKLLIDNEAFDATISR
ncbi:MAG TPA: hypothetical protein VEX43_00995 [Chthoniobacterales bacterium]|nr:hypothetical protein [Chthoniobacterales bacterium]